MGIYAVALMIDGVERTAIFPTAGSAEALAQAIEETGRAVTRRMRARDEGWAEVETFVDEP